MPQFLARGGVYQWGRDRAGRASCSTSPESIMDVEDMSKSGGGVGPPPPPLPLFKSLREARDVLNAARDDGELAESGDLDAFFQRIERLLQRMEEGGDGTAIAATDTFVVSVEGLGTIYLNDVHGWRGEGTPKKQMK